MKVSQVSPYHPKSIEIPCCSPPTSHKTSPQHTSAFWMRHPLSVPQRAKRPGPNETDGIEEIAAAQKFRQKVNVVFILRETTWWGLYDTWIDWWRIYWWIDDLVGLVYIYIHIFTYLHIYMDGICTYCVYIFDGGLMAFMELQFCVKFDM